MKKLIVIFSFLSLSLLQSCGKNNGGGTTLPSGASAIFDAQNASGTNNPPGPGCSTTTWVNTINSTQNGTINCALGGGFAGSGIFTAPYRLEFNGVSTSVSTSIDAQASTMPSSTWVAWVNPNQVRLQEILSLDDHTGSFNRSLIIRNGNWGAYTGAGVYEAVSASIGSWQHIAVVFTPSNIILYKNGTPYSFGSAPTTINTAQTLAIGSSADGSFDFFQGAIAWVAIYPKALTQTEISNSCNALAGRFNAVVCN